MTLFISPSFYQRALVVQGPLLRSGDEKERCGCTNHIHMNVCGELLDSEAMDADQQGSAAEINSSLLHRTTMTPQKWTSEERDILVSRISTYTQYY